MERTTPYYSLLLSHACSLAFSMGGYISRIICWVVILALILGHFLHIQYLFLVGLSIHFDFNFLFHTCYLD